MWGWQPPFTTGLLCVCVGGCQCFHSPHFSLNPRKWTIAFRLSNSAWSDQGHLHYRSKLAKRDLQLSRSSLQLHRLRNNLIMHPPSPSQKPIRQSEDDYQFSIERWTLWLWVPPLGSVRTTCLSSLLGGFHSQRLWSSPLHHRSPAQPVLLQHHRCRQQPPELRDPAQEDQDLAKAVASHLYRNSVLAL